MYEVLSTKKESLLQVFWRRPFLIEKLQFRWGLVYENPQAIALLLKEDKEYLHGYPFIFPLNRKYHRDKYQNINPKAFHERYVIEDNRKLKKNA